LSEHENAERHERKIGIIGSGHIGGTLARRLGALGHDVAIANSRGPQTLSALAAEAKVQAANVEEAVRGKDLIVVTIPEKAVAELPKGLFAQVPESVVVVDTCNYYPKERDGRIDAIEGGMTESRWVSRQIDRPVVKAFNNIGFSKLLDGGLPPGSPGRIALPIAGDDPAAKAMVIKLVDDLGFDAVDAGGLDESWRQQPGTPAYLHNADITMVKRQLAEASPIRKSEFMAN